MYTRKVAQAGTSDLTKHLLHCREPASNMVEQKVQDFSSMFSWILGMSVAGGSGAAIVLSFALSRDSTRSSLGLSKRSLWLASLSAATPLASTAVGLLLVYLGVPFLQPSWGWKPPEKRSRTCAKLRYSAQKAKDGGPWDVIVIGSGMGGLTCASVLAQLGYKVIVLEAHEVAGGSTHDYHVGEKTDWKFPSGLHYTIPASEEMLQVACGAQRPPVHFARMGDDTILHDNAYDRVRLTKTCDKELRIISDLELKADLRERFPALIPQLERFETISMELLKAFPVWCAIHAFPWRFQPTLMRSLIPSAWWRYAGRSGEDVLNEIFADAPESERENVLKLQGYLCGLWLDAGCPPHRVSFFMIAAVGLGFPHEGGAYPEHGTGEMAAALVQSLEARGGSCFVRAPVSRILLDDATGKAVGVELTPDAGGGQLLAKSCVVAACGWRNTAKLCKGSKFPDVGELELPQGDGYVMANIGIRGSASELKLECTNLELLPAGQGVSVFDGIRAYLKDPLGVPPMEIPMMITFPSVKDRQYKHKAKTAGTSETAQILCLAETEWFGKVEEPATGTSSVAAWRHPRRTSDYEELKEKWTERLRSALLTIYPQLEGKIELFDVSTPLTIEHYLPTGSGSAIGLDTSSGKGCRFTDFKVMKLLDMRTPVPGLWLTGQDTLLCGVPLAQAAGLITAMRIAGPFRSTVFVLRTIWLLVASLGNKARERTINGKPAGV